MVSLRLATRTLFKTPFVTTVAIVSLALGIGANAAISLFEQMLLRALPVPEPGRLVNLSAPGPKPGHNSSNNAGPGEAVFSYPGPPVPGSRSGLRMNPEARATALLVALGRMLSLT